MDLVAILSPSTAHRDRGIKLDRYRHFGVPEYWIVDIDGRSLEVWRLGEGAEVAEEIGFGGDLRWEPIAGRTVLRVPIAEVLAGA